MRHHRDPTLIILEPRKGRILVLKELVAAMSNCLNVLASGTCSDTNCSHCRNVLNCGVCGLVFVNKGLLAAHMVSRKHKSKVAINKNTTLLHCSVCGTNIHGVSSGVGRNHVGKAEKQGVPAAAKSQPPDSTNYQALCETCQVLVNGRWPTHAASLNHKAREGFVKYRAALEEAETDKHGVEVHGIFDLGFVDPETAKDGVQSVSTIRTSLPFSKSVLVDTRIVSSYGLRNAPSPFSATVSGTARNITTLRPLEFVVTFRTAFIGRYEDRVELLFEDTQLQKRFVIARTLTAIVGNKENHQLLQPKAPYIPRVRSTLKPILAVVEGVRPPAITAIKYIVPLPRAPVPPRLIALLSGTERGQKQADRVRSIFLPTTLDSDSYGRHFKHLLWIEEYRMEQDLESYDITAATLDRHNNYYYLAVPGLAEKRPSILVGDQIYVQALGATDGRWFEGHVHVVRQAEVGLRFHSTFAAYSHSGRFHVRFRLNRIPVRRQHQAMDSAFAEDRVLFPNPGHISKTPLPSRKVKLYNPLIAKNEPQLQAVISIVSQSPGSLPFVVFGPPGTGKTVTIVEAIQQVLVADPQTKILACAPSNSAADLIALRLRAGLNPNELFRFYAPSRFKDQVPDDLRDYTQTNVNGYLTVPLMARLKKFRVIVSTCISSSFASGVGVPRGHFSHIFIDEAGQATEPEALVAIKMLADRNTNIVLSGDPKQLGPIIRSGIARDLGLELSYLERLTSRDVYRLQEGYGRSIVKLTKNFRSHEAILRFPKDRFYNGDLMECGALAIINSYLKSPYLPNRNFPIIFHSVSGRDDREASSPSFFNVEEVLQVKAYVRRLKEDRYFRTTDRDIGIITPYHAQCLKIRKALAAVADGVKVGSVEEFQGQERRVIIISTVRSSKEFVQYDLRHTLGFVASPRRFNVAVTRAQALLIVIGDPQVLSLDPLWRSFLNYIYRNKGWVGPDIPWDPEELVNEAGGYDKAIRQGASLDMNDFVRRMEEFTLGELEEEMDVNVDWPWRDNE